MNTFLKDLEAELQPKIDKILNHRFIHRILDGWLNKEQMQYFALQYGIYVAHFPRILAGCAGNVPDDPTRIALIENLWDEHGHGVMEKSHRILYKNFALATGVSDEEYENAEPLSTTEICVENLMHICQDQHFLIGLGAIGPGTEYFTNEEYIKIESGLKKYKYLTPEDYEFWTTHIVVDEDHYSDLFNAILPWTETKENQQLIKAGAEKALALEHLFWEGLEDNLPHK